jgi:hypothetical protein
LGLAEIDPYVLAAIGFGSTVLAAIVIKILINRYMQPLLGIDGDDAIIVREFQLHSHGEKGHLTYLANRISVRNTGRSSAKDCKAYIDYGNDSQRVAWLTPDKNKDYTITLNVQDRGFVDLCAIGRENLIRIIPPEQGYMNEYDTEYATRLSSSIGKIDMTLRISCANAKPTERGIRLYDRLDIFPNAPGRIVEFIQ